MLDYERKAIENGYILIAGMDEAGRGPLAGPVCTASVIMPLNEEDLIQGINDSKKLSAKKRELLYDQIIDKALTYTIEFIDEETIDTINILQATKLGMKRCIENLALKPDMVLIDAIDKLDVNTNIQGIIKGDQLSYSIACASILAKVSRDRYMKEQAKLYPNYNFDKHSGYGTKAHIEALKQYGACNIHRKSFLSHFLSPEQIELIRKK